MRLAGKVAMITGAGAGIGRATAELFAREGASVVLAERDPSAARTVEQAITSSGGSAIIAETDVSQAQQVEAAVELAVARYGRLDILYNNAGGSTPADGLVTEIGFEAFWEKMQVDLFGVWLGCHYAIPHMMAQGGGAVINATSMCAVIGTPGRDAYTAAKGAIIALTRSMAVEFAAHNVRVNAVAPGVTTTERVVGRMKPGGYSASITPRHLLGLPDPSDVAAAVLYLASEDSRRTTGHVLPVDSGLTIS